MVWSHLKTLRAQVVILYLGILALLLLGLGIFQSVTLGSYFHSTTVDSLRDSARAELTVLGPCFIPTEARLHRNAQALAGLLGSRETAVKIVSPTGATLADHGTGPPGATQALQLSAATIHQLISGARPKTVPGSGSYRPPSCGALPPRHIVKSGNPKFGWWQSPTITMHGMLLLALPLGQRHDVLGYAILGRSLASVNDTADRIRSIFTLGALAALLLAALIALPLLSHALRPLRRITATAEAIAGGDLEKRASLAHSPDEIGRLGTAFDSMVDRLQAALSAATASEERMRRFLADASHELRTPLTALRGTTQVLLRQGGSGRPDVDHALRTIHDETVRLSRLVDDLLTLSRLDAGQRLDPQPVALRAFLEQFVDRYGNIWQGRTIWLDNRDVDGAVAFVDPEALRRVLTNLIDNAAKYSAPSGRIEVAATVQDGTITIAIRDQGPGLRPEEARRIFDRFYRVSKSRSRQRGGTGLGLSIVHALVQQSGGQMSVETGPDRGTTVSVTLPRMSQQS